MISNEFAMKLCLEHEEKCRNKVVKKELIVALRGEIYFMKFIINPEEDDVEPRMGKSIRNKMKQLEKYQLIYSDMGISMSTRTPLTQEETKKEALAISIYERYSLLEEERPIIETIAYNDKYKKILDEICLDKMKLDGMNKEEEEAIIKIKGEALIEKDDTRAFVILIRQEGKINLNALVDIGSDINVAVTTIIVKFLILDMPIDRDTPILMERGFLHTYGGIKNTIDNITSTFDGIFHQTFCAAKTSLVTTESDSDDEEETLTPLISRIYPKSRSSNKRSQSSPIFSSSPELSKNGLSLGVGKGFSGVETPLFEVPTADEEPSISSPTPPTPPPQPSHDIPSTSQKVRTSLRVETSDETVMDYVSNQGRMIAKMDQDADVVLEDDKEVADEAKEVAKDAKDDETEPAEVQEVVDVVTTTKLITKVVTAASETINAASTNITAELNKNIDWDRAIDHVKRKAKEDPVVKRYQRLNETSTEKAAKRQKLDDEVEELKRYLQIVPNEDDDVYTKATPLAQKVHVVNYQIIEMNNKPYYKIIRADDTHQLYTADVKAAAAGGTRLKKWLSGRVGRGARRTKELVRRNNQTVGELDGQGNNQGVRQIEEFLACNPKEYNGRGGVIVYTRWIKKMESIQDMSGCRDNQKVKYTTGSFVGKVSRGGRLYEFDKRGILPGQLVPHLVTPESKRIERYIYGLVPQIYGMVAATEPATIPKAVKIAGTLTDEAIRNGSLKKNTKKRGNGREPSRDKNVKDNNKRSRTGNAYATTANQVRREYT
nr:hypothetical protein [Tanacetum cinerariifolium]